MQELDYFRRQFLFTTQDNFDLPWKREKILNFNLFYHPDLEFEHSSNEEIELYLLGFLFDYENPEYSNKQILNSLSCTDTIELFFEQLANYSGHYVIIYKTKERLILLNDACAQHEVYYDTGFSSFGTQPKLLAKVISLLPDNSAAAKDFYSSSQFLEKRIFVGETTHLQNVLHLLPNHYIDIINSKKYRFFPKKSIGSISIYQSSIDARKMLKGYLKAASLRYKLGVGVTAGYDSRVLFLASLDLDCKFYLTKLSSMNQGHHDFVVPKRLAKVLNKELIVIDDEIEIDNDADEILDASVDFPLYTKRQKDLANHIIINGNISEIARNDYLYYKKISPEELAILNRTSSCELGRQEYDKWLQNSSGFFSKLGYNVLDMFYWEERMSHLVAKGKTVMSALGVIVYSPFCSHKLLITLLSTPREYRDYYHNVLYNLIIKELVPGIPKIAINPYLKNRIKKLLRFLGILYVYKRWNLKRKVRETFGTKPRKYYRT